MSPRLQLAYLVFDVRKPAVWDKFMRGMFDPPEPLTHADGSTGWRIDGACQRIVVRPGERDDLAALGLECADERMLSELVATLRSHGKAVEQGAPALCEARRVRSLWQVQDPQGNTVELCVGLQQAAEPFASSLFPDGFRTGDLGLGHAVLVSDELPAMEAFYCGLLGFGVTERLATKVGPIEIRGTFLHCNRRHHSLALFDMPLKRRLHHFMLQANTQRDVGMAFERAEAQKWPSSLGLGQHPAPDNTFSFYSETPSGFEFEIGAGTQEIDPADWATVRTSVTSAWGHKPRLRLKLKMARGLLAAKLRGSKAAPHVAQQGEKQ